MVHELALHGTSLRARRKHLEGEVFEMLLTFTDFVAFKELVLDYKAVSSTIKTSLSSSFMFIYIKNSTVSIL